MNFDRVVILHGKPSIERLEQPGFDASRANWLGWLADELRATGLSVMSPKLKEPGNPNFDSYLKELDKLGRFAGVVSDRPCKEEGLGERVVVIAHSAAVGPALEWGLSNAFEGQIIGVAPWWVELSEKYPGMRAPSFDLAGGKHMSVQSRVKSFGKRVTLFSSSDDGEAALENFEELDGLLPSANAVELEGFGHFVTGNTLSADYDLNNGLRGSRLPILLTALEDI